MSFIVIATMYIIYIKEGKQRSDLVNLIKVFIIFTVFTCAILLWKYIYFGDIKSNPSYVKLAVSIWLNGINDYFLKYFTDKGALFSVAFFISSILLLVKMTYTLFFSRDYRFALISFLSISTFSISAIFSWISGGDYMPFYRFIIPYYPFLILILILTPVLYSKQYGKVIFFQGLVASIVIYSASYHEKVLYPRWWKVNFQNPNTALKHSGYDKAVDALSNEMKKHPNDFYALSEFGYIPYHLDYIGLDIMGLNQKEIARTHKIYSINKAVNASRDFIFSKTPYIISVSGDLFMKDGIIKANDSLSWFFTPYLESNFFKKYYKNITEVSSKPKKEFAITMFARRHDIPHISYLNRQVNSEFLLSGFIKKQKQTWMSPLARIMLFPTKQHKELVFKGYIPDIQSYPGNTFNIQFKFNQDSVGDKIFFEKNIKKSGIFEVRIPINPLVAKPNQFFLLTIKSSKLNSKNSDTRNLSCLFVETAFR